MHMSAAQRIPAPQPVVWEALNDPDVLRRSLVGCERLDRIGDGELGAALTARIGPVKARFTGKIVLSEIDPPCGYRITGEGEGGAAGFAKGGATVTLAADGEATLLTYDVEATVGGKLAQIGSRVVDAAARKMAEDFFARFTEIVSARAATAARPSAEPAAEPGRGLPTVVWAAGLIVVVGLLLWLFS